MLGGLAPSHAQDHREHHPQSAQSTQAEPKAAPTPPPPITVTGPVRVEREKEPEPEWDKLKCGEAKSHDEADLCEQRRMAKAAERTVQLNWVQIGVGLAGFLALLYSLALNRQATNFAGNAAKASEKGVAAAIRAADAAEKAVVVARETAQKQLRAFIFGKGFQPMPHIWEGKVKEYVFSVPYENVGLTQATEVRNWLMYKEIPVTEQREPRFVRIPEEAGQRFRFEAGH